MTTSDATRQCGSCTLCCRLLAIEVLQKPASTSCRHCREDQGCGIYAARPDTCRDYLCGWLLNPGLPDHWRPEASGMILGRNLDGVPTLVLDPAARHDWRREPFVSDLRRIAADPATSPGGCVAIICGAEQLLFYKDSEIRVDR